MRTIRLLLEKEFRQIFRNKALVAMITVIPMVQLIILPLAANYEVKNITLAVTDHDHSVYSQKLLNKITASGYFKLAGYGAIYNDAYKLLEADKADLILEIPAGFEKELIRQQQEKVSISVNAINGVKASLGGNYLNQIINAYSNDVREEWLQAGRFQEMPTIEPAISNWYNPYLNYRLFMVPGILAVLVTMIGGYMSALNIVKEKEMGTIDQINVTPIKKYHFILGKLLPFWILGMFIFSLGLGVVAFGIYGIIPQGSIPLLYAFLAVYLFAVLGFGLLVSTYSETQQQAMSVAFFFIMIFLLMSGLFTPIDSMPDWARMIAKFNPVTYFIEVMRMVVLKGSGFKEIRYHLLIVTAFALVLNGWAIINYRKTT